MNYIVLIIIVIVIIVIYKILLYVNNTLLFHPKKADRKDNTDYFREQEQLHNIKITDGTINSDDEEIYFIYIKKNLNDKLFIFAHGNAGNILNKLNSPVIQFMLRYGSVIMFDYRGYGYSTGSPSDSGIKKDTLAIWNYSVDTLSYNPKDIILYGRSLGCSCVSWLGSNLVETNRTLPKAIIMQSGFYSIKEIVSDLLHPYATYIVLLDLDNNKYIKIIKKYDPSYPIIIMHSEDDDLINCNHSRNLARENNAVFCEIYGTHSDTIYSDQAHQIVQELVEK